MTTYLRRHRIATAVAASLLLLGAAPAFAAGFQLNEVSGSGLGNAFAGAAASAEDASTLWSNVAGLSRLGSRQVVGVLHLITPVIRFHDSGSIAAARQPAPAGEGGDAGGLNVVPNLYIAWPLNHDLVLGLGVNSPWGLVTDYDAGWIGRFQADKSDIMTLNVNPALSYKLSPNLALGVGLNWQRMLAEFSNQLNYSARSGLLPVGVEAPALIKGSDNALGWNLGVLWDLSPEHRLGVHYRSAVQYHLKGVANFGAVPGAVPAASYPIRSDVKLPPVANLSYFGTLGRQWDLMADLQWTGWSTIQALRFEFPSPLPAAETPEHFKDGWKLAVGANWRLGGPWTLKGGLAYDQTPVRDAYRTPRLPDSDRTWLSVGVQYQPTRELRLDLGGAYLRSQRSTIHDDGRASGGALLDGYYRSHTTILSGQATYAF